MDRAYSDMAGALNQSSGLEMGNGTGEGISVHLSRTTPTIKSVGNDLVCRYPGCKSSGRVYKRPYELTRHNLIHYPAKKLVCPIHECKYKKKGKFHTRGDKFREHIETHGEQPIYGCPVFGCTSLPAGRDAFEIHLAKDHDDLERAKLKTFLEGLRIDLDRLCRICPLGCCNHWVGSYWDRAVHVQSHDLSERVRFSHSLKSLGIELHHGRVTCPICRIQVCDEYDRVDRLFYHLERLHSLEEMVTHDGELARLIWPFKSTALWFYEKLASVIHDFTITHLNQPAANISSLDSLSAGSISTSFVRPVEFPNAGKNDRSTEDHALGGFERISKAQLWPEQMAMPQQQHTFPQSCMLQPNFMPQWNPIVLQSQTLSDSFMPQHISGYDQDLLPQPNFMAMNAVHSSQEFSDYTSPMTPQSMNQWQPIQASMPSTELNQFSIDSQIQWPPQLPQENQAAYSYQQLQPGMDGSVSSPMTPQSMNQWQPIQASMPSTELNQFSIDSQIQWPPQLPQETQASYSYQQLQPGMDSSMSFPGGQFTFSEMYDDQTEFQNPL